MRLNFFGRIARHAHVRPKAVTKGVKRRVTLPSFKIHQKCSTYRPITHAHVRHSFKEKVRFAPYMTCAGIRRGGEGTPPPQEGLLQWWMSTRTGKHRRRRPARPMWRVHAGCLQWGHGSRRKAQGRTPHVHTTRTPLSSTQQPRWYQATPLRTHDTSHR